MTPPAPPFRSVVAAFAARLASTPDRILVRLFAPGSEVRELSYAALHEGARRAAGGLRELGARRGDRVVLGLPASAAFFHVYFGALMSGVVPIVIPEPRKKVPAEIYAAHVGLLLGATEAKLFIAGDDAPAELGPLLPVPTVTWARLAESGGQAELSLDPPPEQLAHLQATSGSTGVPRLAEIRHQNIAANVAAIGQAIRHRDGDVLLSWLPLFHDMGLIGVSYSLLWDCPLVMAEAATFARNPLVWLKMIHRFRGTLSPAPNSAFKLCARLAERAKVDDLDLSSWRVALCGAEPIHADTVDHFQRAFGPRGFRAETMLPVYGLAEATLSATMTDPDLPPHVDEVDAEELQRSGRCVPPRGPGPALRNVSLGRPVPGHELRVVDGEGRPLPARQIGEVEFRGPSVIRRYWGFEDESPDLKREGFLRTGDLGYLDEGGRLYVTGRQKDIIICNGRNFVPFQIEEEVARLIGSTLPTGIAAVGVMDPQTHSEGVHLVVETVDLPHATAADDEARIRNGLEQAFGLTGITVHWKPKGWNPKTTSGKLQRYRCKEKLLAEREGG